MYLSFTTEKFMEVQILAFGSAFLEKNCLKSLLQTLHKNPLLDAF